MTRHAMARLAGWLYLATLPTAGFAYGYVAFMPKDDPAALLAALEAARPTLGWTVLLGAVGFVDYLVLAALFTGCSRRRARSLPTCWCCSSPRACRSRSRRWRSAWS